MNPGEFASLPGDACTLDTEGSFGPDRITRTTYDAANRPTLVQTGYGVSGVQADEAATAYTANGRIEHVTDAEGNRTTYEYDGHDRLAKTRFPVTTPGANQSSTTDYEQLTLDASGNVTSRRLRDGQSIGYTYDALDRPTFKDLPGSEPDVTFGYDLLGQMTSASTSLQSLSFTWDALGRNLSQGHPLGTASSQYDAAGNRTRLTWPDGFYVDYDYDMASRMTAIRENGATSGPGVLVTIGYDDLGRRTSLSRGNGAATTYAWDPVSRLAQLSHDLAGTSSDLTLGFSYNPAGQIVSNTRSNDAFAFTGYANENVSHAANGLNQLTTAGAATLTYDQRGNLTSDGTRSFTYSSENLLTSRTEGIFTAPFNYDPLTRFSHSGDNRFLTYQGELIGEYQVNALAGRYVHGPGADEPLVLLTSGGTRYWVHADERGSNIATSIATGAFQQANRYDEYGRQTSGSYRFRYTGQIILTQDILYYKARIYDRALGRFMQADPIGYGDGMNMYSYVRNDPINRVDPTGLFQDDQSIYVLGQPQSNGFTGGGTSGYSSVLFGSRFQFNEYIGSGDTGNILGCSLGNSLNPFGACGATQVTSVPTYVGIEEEIDNALTFREIGLAGETAALRYLIAMGHDIVGQQVRIMTPAGLRIVDIVTIEPGGRMVAYEVKANTAQRDSLQLLKDSLLQDYGGIVISAGIPSLPLGAPIRLPTGVLHVTCRTGCD